ncbi:eukaryotic porin-domain-containing protein [Phlyctochytrium arcticum]|nr:eukaryotic porin-domain-containing protein [Phlyctochytrium arcticum]
MEGTTLPPAPVPAATSVHGGLFGGLADLRRRMNLPSPGSWEGLHREAKMVQPTNFLIEGAKFDLTSILTPHFQVMHSLSWGATQFPPSYNFGAVYAKDKMMLHGQVDDQGGLQARANINWLAGPSPVMPPQDPTKPPHEQAPPVMPEPAKISSTTKMTAHLTNQPGQNMVQVEHDHIGSDFSFGIKAVNPNLIDKGASWQKKGSSAATGIYQLAYLQSVTPSVAVGAELVYNRMMADVEESSLSYAFRYAPPPCAPLPPPSTVPLGMPSPFPPADPKAPTQVLTSTFQPGSGLLHTTYWRRLNQRLEVFTELQLLMTRASAMGEGRREGIASLGFKLDTLNASIRAMVDTAGRLSAVLEERIVGGLAFHLSGEIDYAKGGGGQGRVGIGFTLEA